MRKGVIMNWLCRFIVVFLCLFTLSIYAEGISPIEKDIFNLEHVGLRVSAVENDMRFFIGWEPVEKPEWKEPAEKAISDLEELKTEIKGLALSEVILPLGNEFIAVITKLQKVYSGIEVKTDEAIEKELGEFWSAVEVYNNKIKGKIETYLLLPELSEDSNYMAEDKKLFTTEKDRKEFEKLDTLVENKEYFKALVGFENLWGKYKDTPAEGAIITRLVECGEKNKETGYARTEEFITTLNSLIEKKAYYPNLYLIFYQWRTLDQYFSHGASNWSEIPNDKYISKRWLIANTIKDYISKNPADKWAKFQLAVLMDLLIIQRGGPYGNTNMRHWGALFTDLLEKKDEE